MVFGIILTILVELIADPIKNYVVTPIKCHISYAFKCDSNVQRLQQQVEQLQNKKDRLQHSVADATRNGEAIYSSVTEWLTAAEKDMREAEELIQRKEEAKRKCCFGFCPDLKASYQLSKGVEKKALAIDKLCNEQGSDPISFQPPLELIVEPSLYRREALPSRVLMLNQVINALRDPNLNPIGVYGMGGVGKTTLAKEVLAKAQQEKLFEAVVLVTVSQEPDLRRIQREIADFLGLRFSAEEIPGRASQLHRRLEKSKVLIILDDLWQKLDLNALGIPSQGASRGRCKIMLTSRISRLLSIEMSAQKLFVLETLNQKETMSLFQMSVPEANNPQFHAIATQLAQRCVGLPLMIQIVAAGLRNKELHEWRNTLNKLSTFDDEDLTQKVGNAIESSYDNLPETELKSLFLLCTFFGQYDIRIQFLLTYSLGMGLIKHIHSIESARDKVLIWISKLKAASLLMDGGMVGFAKMHNVVRDVALQIASREQHSFVGSGEVSLRGFSNRDCTGIALPFCNIRELPVGLNYPAAELFLLFTEDLSLEVPDSFFNGLKKLKVVDFTGMHLVHFPSSISLLANLRTLCLHRCRLDNVDILGALQHLEFLSFANSNIIELPKEIEYLVRLKLLDLSSCSYLQVIPAGVLLKLCSLEELYMLNSFVRWDTQDNVSLVELENLACLSTLEIHIPDLKLIPVGFKCFSLLKSYKISIGDVWDWDEQYERSRTLKLQGEAGVHLEGGTELLLRESEDLYFDGVIGIQSIFNEGFLEAKHMHIENDFDIQHVIKSTRQPPCDAFPVLELLYLNKLHNLEKIFRDQLSMESFGALKILKIGNCDKLKCLFSFSSGKCLQQLRELEVESCENMEGVVDEGIEEVHHNYGMMEFTQLSSLKLKNLPQLIGFYKSKDETEQTGLLFNTMVSFPDLTSLEVNGCKSLKHISSVSTMKCLMQLISLKIEDCELDGEIIQSKKMEEIEEDNTELIVFPKLDCLSLLNLINVKRFSYRYSFEFPLLTELRIEGCCPMRNFVSNELATFSNLERIDVGESSRDGGLLEGLQPHENIKRIRINIKYYMEEKLPSWMLRMKSPSRGDSFLVLNNLVDLKLEWCNNCVQLPSLGNLPHLKFLEMSNMGKVKCIDNEFYGFNNERRGNGGLNIFPALQSLSLTWMENLTEWSSASNSKTAVVFPRLEKLSIQCCPKLTGFPMSDLSALANLDIKDCQELRLVIGEQKSFSSLSGLSLTACSKFTHLRNWLKPIKSFKELSVTKCEWLEFVPHDLQKVSSLTSLEIYCCRRLKYFPEDILSELTKLQHLSIGAFSEELDDFCYLNRTKELWRLEELEIWGSDFFGREMHSLPNQLQHLSSLKSLKVMGFAAMEALPEWLTNLESLRMLSLDYCRNLGYVSMITTIQRLPKLWHLSISSCPILLGSESEWLLHSHSRKIEVELSQVSKVRLRLGY